MRIVQTFWSGNSSPFKNAFGWAHPEYNLMAWALSCLSLREFYDDVVLYTDNAGQKCLVDLLQLPYSEVHTIYDKDLCLSQHWAYAKIKTYSLQQEPFVHIDGDVFLPSSIPSAVLNAPLLTQNVEYGTDYYDQMLDRFLQHPGISVPDWLLDSWKQKPILSHNMGLFGGSDLDFIHRYCNEVERLLQGNRINDPADPRSSVNANVIFEQMVFGAMAESEGREVRTLLRDEYEDTGYSSARFCNFERWNEAALLHIVGGNKRVAATCEAMERKLFNSYPEYFLRIARLFPDRHPYVGTPMEEGLIRQATHEDSGQFFPTGNAKLHIERNPYVRIMPYYEGNCKTAVYAPSIFSTGCKNLTLNPLGMNILNLLEDGGRSFGEITDILTPYFGEEMRDNSLGYITEELKFLLHYGVISINN